MNNIQHKNSYQELITEEVQALCDKAAVLKYVNVHIV